MTQEHAQYFSRTRVTRALHTGWIGRVGGVHEERTQMQRGRAVARHVAGPQVEPVAAAVGQRRAGRRMRVRRVSKVYGGVRQGGRAGVEEERVAGQPRRTVV